MTALAAGSYVGGMGLLTPRVVSPRIAARTGANVRGVVLDSYLGRGVMPVPAARIRMGALGDSFNACTDSGYRTVSTVTTSLLDVVGRFIEDRAGTRGEEGYDAGLADAARVTRGAADVYGAGYEAACAPPAGTPATTPTVGSPTNAEITALLSATREELASARLTATEADAARAREAAASSQRTQQYLMIGGGLAVAALVAVLVLRK